MSKIIKRTVSILCTCLLSSLFVFNNRVMAKEVNLGMSTSTPDDCDPVQPNDEINNDNTDNTDNKNTKAENNVTSDGFVYEKNEDGTIKITGYNSIESDITIPSEINGIAVTSIAKYAFCHAFFADSIKVPESISNIEPGAFIIYTNSLIGDEVNLKNIEVDSNNKRYCSLDGVLYNKDKSQLIACPKLKEGIFTVPETVSVISDYAFSDCKIEQIIMNGNINSIGEAAFRECKKLSSIIIPEGVQDIGKDAFQSSSIKSINIPSTVTSIGSGAFGWCIELESISLGDNIEEIKENTFICCTKLNKIQLPKNIKRIKLNAFFNCTALEDINIPEKIESIDNSCFNFADNLKSIKVDDNNKNYCSIDGILYSKDKTTLEIFPKNYKIDKVTLPNSVNTIKNNAFTGNSSLKSIVLPASVGNIGEKSFFGCYNLESISVDSENKQYSSDENGILYNKDKTILILCPKANKSTDIILPDTVEVIKKKAFEGCKLKSIKLSKALKTIEDSAFGDCISLSNVEIQDGLNKIGSNSFCRCTNLKSIRIPDSVEEIDDSAFLGDIISIFASENSYAGKYGERFSEPNTSTSSNTNVNIATNTNASHKGNIKEYKIGESANSPNSGDVFNIGSVILVLSSLTGMVAVTRKKQEK